MKLSNESGPAAKKTNKSHKLAKSVIILVLIIIVALGSGTFWLFHGSLTAAKENVFRTIPLPIAFVNGRPISGNYFFARLDIAKKISASQNGLGNQQQLRQNIFNSLIEQTKIAQLARQRGVSASSKQIDLAYQEAVKAQNNLPGQLKTYGFTQNSYKEIILRPQIELDNLQSWYYSQADLNKEQYALIQQMQAALMNGSSFKELAMQYSEDPATKNLGGDLGFTQISDLMPELREGVESLSPGQSQSLPSRYGIHFIQLLEKDNNGAQGASRVHLRQIFLKPTGFESWYNDEVKNFNVRQLINL
jgi:flagellar basal body-associated protein FliL